MEKRRDTAIIQDVHVPYLLVVNATVMIMNSANDAAVKGVPIRFKKEECAKSTGQRSNYAAVKVAQR